MCGNLQARKSFDVEEHMRLDGVLYPAFTAKMNDWTLKHSREPHHEQTFDVKDAARWKLAREAWHDMDEAAKAIGY